MIDTTDIEIINTKLPKATHQSGNQVSILDPASFLDADCDTVIVNKMLLERRTIIVNEMLIERRISGIELTPEPNDDDVSMNSYFAQNGNVFIISDESDIDQFFTVTREELDSEYILS